MTYEELVEIARRDDAIVGLVLTGSRGSGFGFTEESDWDVRLIVHDDVRDEYGARFAAPHGSRVEVVVLSEAELEDAGEIGTRSAWDRYSWVHADVVVDKGRVEELVMRKSTLPPESARTLAAQHLDDYVNWYYRSAKNAGLGIVEGARLDAAESVSSLLDFLFAAHGRVRPFNKFLRSELETHPLPGATWTAAVMLPRLVEILDTGRAEAQQRMFRDVEALARAHGLGGVIDGWEPDVSWLRGQGSP
jgi:predicted nucleotidyltransferase